MTCLDRPPSLCPESLDDADAIEALLDHAFGPARFTKVSERVRERALARRDLSFCAWQQDRLVGCVRQSLIKVGQSEAIFLGPLAVEPDQQRFGTGSALVQAACRAADGAGHSAILLVGDEPYFGRFGFSAASTSGVILPGPVDPRRVLARSMTGVRLIGRVIAPDATAPVEMRTLRP